MSPTRQSGGRMDGATDALALSGERFDAVYRIRAVDAGAAEARALAICVEQTVEFPPHLIDDPAIIAGIVGTVASVDAIAAGRFEAVIRYPVEAAGAELTQLLNVLFGNVGLYSDIQLADLRLPDALLRDYRGPRFGIAGLRDLVDVHRRPLLCTALKPMGLSPAALARLAYRLALGGIDLIKDDHGLADQPFSPFNERVPRCAEAIRRANRETGRRCLYLPNVTAPARAIEHRARLARACGAGGLLFCPGLAGLDAMRALAADDELALPVLSHPAFHGGLIATTDGGLSHRVLYGRLNRLAGADATIFPSYGGRFAYTPEQCRDIVTGATGPMGRLRAIMPVPAGGMRLDRIEELVGFYGRDCMLLIGGDLHTPPSAAAADREAGRDLVQACRRLEALATRAAAALGP